VCEIASTVFGFRAVRAAVAESNVASRQVLTKAGFRVIGEADPSDIGGKRGRWYGRNLDAYG
jgi:ribosomal-protein-alanine N-acetyltransferase